MERRPSVKVRRDSIATNKGKLAEVGKRASIQLLSSIRGLDPIEAECLFTMKKENRDLEPDISSEPLDNGVLIRFLKATDFNIEKALHGYRQYVSWRRECKIDKVRYSHPKFLDFFAEQVNSQLIGHDNTGRPVLYETFTNCDFFKIMHTLKVEDMQDLLVYRNEHLLENCRKLSKKMNQLVYDICYIVDMEGKFKIPEAEATAVHKELNHFDRWYYPHLYGRIVIINAPIMFERSWKINQFYLLPATIKKVEIIGVDDIHKLAQIIDKEFLPEKYGGKLKVNKYNYSMKWAEMGMASLEENVYEESKWGGGSKGESKYESKSEGKEEVRGPEEIKPERRLSAMNGLRTLTRRLSSVVLFDFNGR